VRTGGGTAELERLDRAWAAAAARTPGLRGERWIARLLHQHAMQLEGRYMESIPGLRRLTGEINDDGDTALVSRMLLAEAELLTGNRSGGAALAADILGRLGEPDESENVLHESLALRSIRCLVHAGQLSEAARQLEQFERQRLDSLVAFGGTVEFLRGWIAFKQGRMERALQLLTPAIESLRLHDPHQLLEYALGLAAEAAGLLNEPEILARHVRVFHEHQLHHRRSVEAAMRPAAKARIIAAGILVGAAPTADDRVAGGMGPTADGRLDAAGGTSTALCELSDLAWQLAGAGRATEETEVQLLRLRLGDVEALPRLRDITAMSAGPEQALLHAFAGALLAKDPEAMLELAQSASTAGYPLLAAETAGYAARLLARDGVRGRYREAVRLVQRLRLQLPGVVTSLQLDESFAPCDLTLREQDVAVLVARGLRSSDVAERLGVPVRTVEGHIYRIYDKLHVRTRDELAAVVLHTQPPAVVHHAAGPPASEETGAMQVGGR